MYNDLCHFRRMPADDPNRNRAYLESLVWAHLNRELQKQVCNQRDGALNRALSTHNSPLGSKRAAAVTPLDTGFTVANHAKDFPCKFFFRWDYKLGPCTRRNCPHSHKKPDFDRFMKEHPNLRQTIMTGGSNDNANPARGGGGGGGGQQTGGRLGRPARKKKTNNRSPTPARSNSRGSNRSPSGRSGNNPRGRSPTRAAGAQKSPRTASGNQIPPSGCCRLHLFHLCLNHKKCPHNPCRYPHPASATDEDKSWAQKHGKGAQPRRNSPAVAASRSTTPNGTRKPSKSPGGTRRRKSPKSPNK